MEKTLVLVPDASLYFFGSYAGTEVTFASVFRKNERLLNATRKVVSCASRPFYGSWYGEIGSYSRIVVMDVACLADKNLLRNIRRKATIDALFLYSWNINLSPDQLFAIVNQSDYYGFKRYSYDEGFCSKHGFHFNSIMFDSSVKCPPCKDSHTVLFLGFAKDRISTIISAKKLLDASGAATDFTVVGDSRRRWQDEGIRYTTNYVSYADYLRHLFSSAAILDIAQGGQMGYSMRVMEALFYDRKLISTNRNIGNASFFSSGNVFLLDPTRTTATELMAFMDKPMRPYGETDRSYYSIESWARRFVS